MGRGGISAFVEEKKFRADIHLYRVVKNKHICKPG